MIDFEDFLREEEENPVGRFDNYVISVYHEPLGNPSFHVRTNDWSKHCAYQIKDFKLLEQKTKEAFSSKELKDINSWLSKENPDILATNWKMLIATWNLTNPDNKVSKDTKLPM